MMPPHRYPTTEVECPKIALIPLRGRINHILVRHTDFWARLGWHLGILFRRFSLACGSFHMRNVSSTDADKLNTLRPKEKPPPKNSFVGYPVRLVLWVPLTHCLL